MTTTTWIESKEIMRRDIVALTGQTGDAVIQTDEDAEKVTDMVKLCSALLAKIEEQRKAFTAPINDVVKGINADAKALAGPLEVAKGKLSKMLTAWLQAKQAAATEAARIEREKEEARKLEQASMLESAGFREEADEVVEKAARASAIAERTTPTVKARGNFGASASLTTTWSWEVGNLSLVPLELLQINSVAVNARTKAINEAIENEAMERGLRGKEKEAFIDAERERRYQCPGLVFKKEQKAVTR